MFGVYEKGGEVCLLKGMNYILDITDFTMKKTVIQKFENSGDKPVEMVYKFADNEKCVINFIEVELYDPEKDEKKILKAKIEEKKKAQEKYDDAIAKGSTILVAEKDFDDRVSLNLGNVLPKVQVTVKMDSVEEVNVEKSLGGGNECRMKIKIPSLNYSGGEISENVDNIHVECRIKLTSGGKVTEMKSPSHEASFKYDSESSSLRTSHRVSFNRDIDIEVKVENVPLVSGIIEKQDLGDEHVSAIHIIPNFQENITLQSEFIIIVDCSGSMSGDRMTSAKTAMKRFANIVFEKSKEENTHIKVNVVRFGTNYQCLYDGAPQPLNGSTFEDLVKYIDETDANLCTTNILSPIRHVLSQEVTSGFTRQVFLLTDGEDSNTEEIIRFVRQNARTTRFFTFGIGQGINPVLIGQVAEWSVGRAVFLDENADIEKNVVEQLGFALQPAIQDIKVNFPIETSSVTEAIPACYNLQKLSLYFFSKGFCEECEVSYSVAGNQKTEKVNLMACEGGLYLGGVAAKKRVRELQTSHDQFGMTEEESKSEIRNLGLKYHFLTTQTSFLMEDENEDVVEDEMEKVEFRPVQTSWRQHSPSSQDRNFYDRQLRVLGTKPLERIKKSEVLIVGLSGLGQEVAKNAILSGCNVVHLCDDKNVSWDDLSSSFFFTEEAVGKNRTESCIGELQLLNYRVKVSRVKRSELTKDFFEKLDVCCFTDDPILSLVEMNKLSRSTNVRFISCESRGLFGAVFVDMGREFIVFDDNGEKPVENAVVDITNEKEAMVTVLDDSANHGLGVSDKVVFSGVQGMEELNEMGPVEIDIGEGTGKHTFRIKVDTTGFPKYQRGTGYWKQVKQPITITDFLSLEEAIEKPKVVCYDYGKWDFGLEKIHPIWRAYYDFWVENKNQLPRPYNEEDAQVLLEKVKKYSDGRVDEKFVRLFSYGCRGNISPVVSIVGGIASQEIMKAVSGKYIPLNQWFYFDALECLDREFLPTEEQAQPKNCRYDGNIQVFGTEFQEKLLKQKVMLCGAGSLGQEYLKNFSLLGIGADSGREGVVHVVDMDSLESNSELNKSFLFRPVHLGRMRSTSAVESVKRVNGNVNYLPYHEKLCPETEDFFDSKFWSNLECVVGGLNNIQERLYVDSKCLFHQKPLIEAGIEKTKGSVQVVVPHMTESYGASKDYQEREFTPDRIHTFPHKIGHCVAWAKYLFEEYFMNDPKNVNKYLGNPERYIDDLNQDCSSPLVLSTLRRVYNNMVEERPKTFKDCVNWARELFEKEFVHEIKRTLHNYPEDRMTQGGLPFWTGAKRLPYPLKFSETFGFMKNFVVYASMFHARIYGIPFPGLFNECFDDGNMLNEENFNIPKFDPRKDMLEVVEEEDGEDDFGGDGDERDKIFNKKLPTPDESYKMHSCPFYSEDNETMKFIASAANSRAECFRIPQSDESTIKIMAGGIIPTMVTTAATVAGFGSLEYLKTVRGKKDIDQYRNIYLNLALPLCAMSEPVPPKKLSYYDIEYSEWDFFEVDLGKDVTLREFLDHFKEKHKLVINCFNYDKTLIYADFMPSVDQEEEDRTPLSKLCFQKSHKIVKKDEDWLKLIILVEGLNEEEFDVPEVKYKFRGF